jgi:hypothetical protein
LEESNTLEVNLGEGVEPIRLSSWNDAEDWVEKEQEAWRWLSPEFPDVNVGHVASEAQSKFNWLRNVVTDHKANERQMQFAEADFGQTFNTLTGPIIPSQSSVGSTILSVRDELGDIAAATAYAFHLKRINLGQISGHQALKGVLVSAFPAFEDTTQLSDRLARERANLRSLQRNTIAEFRLFEADRQREWRGLLRSGKKAGLRQLRRGKELWNAQQTTLGAQQHAAISDLNEVKNAYEETMRLKAPVRYWTNKAKAHGRAECWAVARLCLYFPVAFGLLAWAFYEAFALLLHGTPSRPNGQLPQATYFVLSGALLIASTFAFWIGRLLTKLYLSEHHLRIDAEERAVMTTTYLALIRDGAASDAERTIILEALFRQSTDGIVKEEGPGDLNIGSAIARLGIR